jgi:hypothetical protein
MFRAREFMKRLSKMLDKKPVKRVESKPGKSQPQKRSNMADTSAPPSSSKASTPKNDYTVHLRQGVVPTSTTAGPTALNVDVQADSVELATVGTPPIPYWKFTGAGGTVAAFEFDTVAYITSVPIPTPAA